MGKIFEILEMILFGFKSGVKQKGSIKFSALVSEIKGKVGGTVFQGGKAGKVISNKTSKKSVASNGLIFTDKNAAFTWPGCMADELNVTGRVLPDGSYRWALKTYYTRSNLGKLSKWWGALLPEDRQFWNSLAQTRPAKNKFGETYTPSGYQLFIEVNTLLLSAGMPVMAQIPCTQYTFVDDDAQETVVCIDCGDFHFCVYMNDLVDAVARYAIAGIQDGVPDRGASIYSVTTPGRPGSSPRPSTKIIAICDKQTGYDTYLLRPMLNRFFGKNISGQQFILNQTMLLPTGAFQRLQGRLFTLDTPSIGSKIQWAQRLQNFDFSRSIVPVAYGTVLVGDNVVKTFMFYGVDLQPNTSYTLGISGDTDHFSIVYGAASDPLNLLELTTDKYGNILPIPVRVTFNPQIAGTYAAEIAISANGGAEQCSINVTGSGV